MRPFVWTIAGWLIAAAGTASAQAPKPGATPDATQDESGQETDLTGEETTEAPAAGAGAKAKPAAPASAAVPAGARPADTGCNPAVDICLVADTQGRDKGHIWARGFADVRMGDLRIQADSLDIYEEEKAGATTQRLTAEGNVVLLRGTERMAGTKMEMDLDSGRGSMENVVGYVDPGVYLTAERVDRVDSKTFRIANGRFTSCCQAEPRWSFAAHRATLKVGKHISASAVHFDLGVLPGGQKLPFLFLPYLLYPIQESGRATGLLLPSFNIDFKRGVDVREGFFLTMGRSADQTFSAEYRPKMAPRLIHELRWAYDRRAWGNLATTFFPPSTAQPIAGLPTPNKKWDYSLAWNATQSVPHLFTAKLLANVTSPQDYSSTGYTQAYNTTRRMSLMLQRTFGRQLLQVQADNRENVFGNILDSTQSDSNTRRYLPKISLAQAPVEVGHTGLRWEYTARFDQISLIKDRPNAADGSSDRWARFYFSPSFTRIISAPFLTLTPKVTARYTRYGGSCPVERPWCARSFTGDTLARQSLEGEIELAGPRFARVFQGIGGLMKHEIGPEVVWVYRNATDNFDRVPRFDELDNTARAHELRYGITQRLSARRKTQSGEMRPYEFLSWSVYQKRYFTPPLSPYDTDFRTLLFDNPTGTPPSDLRRSPIHSQLKLAPVEEWSLDWLQEYDPNRKKTTRLDLGTNLRTSLARLRATWSRSPARYDDDEAHTLLYPEQNSLNGDFTVNIGRRFLEIGVAADYSLVDSPYFRKGFVNRSVHAKIDGQCISLLLEYRQFAISADANGRQQYNGSFSFAIQLANLGTIGMDPGRAGGLSLGSGGLR